jgi:hypothetical protein
LFRGLCLFDLVVVIVGRQRDDNTEFFRHIARSSRQKDFSGYTLQRTTEPCCKSFVWRSPRITT